jgi:hypothetical protein
MPLRERMRRNISRTLTYYRMGRICPMQAKTAGHTKLKKGWPQRWINLQRTGQRIADNEI